MRRDKRTCQACGLPATDVDHVGDRHDHSLTNLQALCRDCHRGKTAGQSARARSAMFAKLKAPTERPPGLR